MHDLGRWHFHLQSPGIRRCNNECVALWFIMAVPNSWAVYRFPRLCPNFPLAEAEEGPGAMMHVARVFFKGAIILLGRPVKRWPAASALTRYRSTLSRVNRDH